MKFIGTIAVLAWLIAAPAPMRATDGQTDPKKDGVFIVGALHRLHETEEAFTYDALRRVIGAIDPEVLVLEVRQDELSERKDTPGRPEYPKVIWPFLTGSRAASTAMEPGPPLFAEMSGKASSEMKALGERNPDGARRWSDYQKSLELVLQAHWRHPADTQDAATANLSRSYYLTQQAMVGRAFDAVQTQWDAFMVERALTMIRKAPGKRVLVLCSYRNRHLFVDAVRSDAPGRLVDMEVWLRANLQSALPDMVADLMTKESLWNQGASFSRATMAAITDCLQNKTGR
jgi:hypothetical protein